MPRVRYTLYQPDAVVDQQIRDRSVLLIDNDTAQGLLSMEDCLSALEGAFRAEADGAATNRTKSVIHNPTPQPGSWHQYASMEGGIRDLGVVAARIRSHIHSQTSELGTRRYHMYSAVPGKFGGLILLYSSEDGSLLAIVQDGHVQHMRVAATSALSAKHMARPDAAVLGILGSGGMAAMHAWAMATVRPLKRIRLYSPNADHRRALAASLGEDLEIEVESCADPRSVVEGSDIVSACTNSHEGKVVQGDWLQPGTHVTTVMFHELDEAALRRLDRYALYRSAAASQHYTTPADWRPESIGGTDADATQRERAVVGEERMMWFPDVLAGRAIGRADDREITGFNSEGTGVQFAAVAHQLYQSARRAGLGRELPLSWFLQDIKS